jgi:hypothetical protein
VPETLTSPWDQLDFNEIVGTSKADAVPGA